MNVTEARARVRARVWQALAESDLTLKAFPREEVETLVDLVTDAAILEIDAELENALVKQVEGDQSDILAGEEEEILWQGRPLLSLNTRYIVTDERVRIISGLLGKDREDVELVRVQDIDQRQSFGERMLNVGDITIQSHDRSHPTIQLRNVKDPQKVHEIVRRAVLNARKQHGLRYREEM